MIMRVEKTNTGIIIREPNYNIKEKCLEYFSLSDPLREYFIYSGNDPNNKPKFGNEHDVIYITSGFGKIDDPIIKKVISSGHRVQPKKPSPIELNMSREPRSDLQRDCIKLLVSSDTPKITVQLKPGVGKAEPYSRRIPTPTKNGYTLMGDLKVGDFVFGQNGNPTRIIGIFEQGEQDIYKITFQDGRVAYCHEDHLWTVKTSKNGSWKTVLTKNMLSDFKRISAWKEKHGRDDPYVYKYYIPTCVPVNRPYQKVPIDPWVLGCFIGNGCCTCKQLTISSPTDEIPNRIANIYGFEARKDVANYSYVFFDDQGRSIKTADFFKDIPQMIDCYSRDKSIPDMYINNNFGIRLELIRGLMDTDGSIGYDGGRYHTRFSSTSKTLLEQMLNLLYSFGMTGSIIEDKRDEKYVEGYCGNLLFNISNKLKHEFFTVSYKKSIAYEAQLVDNGNRYNDLLIKNIELSHREKCRCIMVDNPMHLYLTEDYIVTHNTFIAMYSASQLGLKPLIVTPSTLLKNQWIEEIEDCGIDRSEIATDIYEVDKKCCVVTITSIENAIRDDWEGCLNAINNGQYGIKIIDEAHLHLKGMLKFDALCNIQHNWYLSATLGRSDGDEDKILNRSLLDSTRFIGSKKYLEYQKEYIRVYQQDIYYQPSQQLCNECFKYGKKGLIKSSYYDMLMEYKNGVPFITNMIDMVKKVRALTKSSKKVLLLIPMLDIIHRVMNVMKGDPYFKSLNVVMVDGSMPLKQKRENLENGNIILATTQSMGVGVDVQDLIAVVNFDQLASPISLEQIVGRLRDRGYETVYIDICDKVKYAKAISNWGARRREMFPYFPGVHKEMYKFPNIYS